MNALVFIAAVVALVWGVLLVTRMSLLAGCGVFLVLHCCFGEYFWTYDAAGITLSLDRVFLLLLLAAYATQVALGKVALQPIRAADWLLLGLITLLCASTAVAGGQDAFPSLLAGYLIPAALYWIVRQAPVTEVGLSRLLVGMVVFGVYLAAVGLCEAAGAWSVVFPRYIADESVGLHFGRARGPMAHAVSYGHFLAVGALACGLWAWTRSRNARVVAAVLIVPMLAALWFTKTRSVWLGAGTGAAVVLACTLRGKWRVGVLGGMAAAAILLLATKSDAILGIKREGTVADTRQSASMRTSFAYVSWQMFQDRPLWGWGFRRFAEAKKPYLQDRSVDLQLEQIRPYVHHNTFLSLLTDTGLVGLGLLVALLAAWTANAWRVARDRQAGQHERALGVLALGALAVAFWQMMAHEISYMAYDTALLFFIGGLTVNLAYRGAVQPTRATAMAPIRRPTVAAR